MVSYAVQSLDTVKAEPLGPVVARPESPYDGRRAATFRGAAGELVELIGLG